MKDLPPWIGGPLPRPVSNVIPASLMKLLYRTNQLGYLLDADAKEPLKGPALASTRLFWTQAVWYGEGCCKEHGSRVIEIQEVDFLEEEDSALPVHQPCWHLYRLQHEHDDFEDNCQVVRQYAVLREPSWEHGEHCGVLRHGLVLRDLASLITAEREKDEQPAVHFHIGLALNMLRARSLDTEESRMEYNEECSREGVCLHEKKFVDRLETELEDLRARFLWLDNRIEQDFDRMCLDATELHTWLEAAYEEKRFAGHSVESEECSSIAYSRSTGLQPGEESECISEVPPSSTHSSMSHGNDALPTEPASFAGGIPSERAAVLEFVHKKWSNVNDSAPDVIVGSSPRNACSESPQLRQEHVDDRDEFEFRSSELELESARDCEGISGDQITTTNILVVDVPQQSDTDVNAAAGERSAIEEVSTVDPAFVAEGIISLGERHEPTVAVATAAQDEPTVAAVSSVETPREIAMRRSDILKFWRDRTPKPSATRLTTDKRPALLKKSVRQLIEEAIPHDTDDGAELQQNYEIWESNKQCRFDVEEQDSAIEITLRNRQHESWDATSDAEACTPMQRVPSSQLSLAKSFMDALTNTVMCNTSTVRDLDVLSMDSLDSASENESIGDERTQVTNNIVFCFECNDYHAKGPCVFQESTFKDANDGVYFFKELERESAAELFLRELEQEEHLYISRSEKLHFDKSTTSEEDATIDVESELRFWKEYTRSMAKGPADD